jgi:hypothetical protein
MCVSTGAVNDFFGKAHEPVVYSVRGRSRQFACPAELANYGLEDQIRLLKQGSTYHEHSYNRAICRTQQICDIFVQFNKEPTMALIVQCQKACINADGRWRQMYSSIPHVALREDMKEAAMVLHLAYQEILDTMRTKLDATPAAS